MQLIKLDEKEAYEHLKKMVSNHKSIKIFDKVYDKILQSSYNNYLFVLILEDHERFYYNDAHIRFPNLFKAIHMNLDFIIQNYTFNLIREIEISNRGIIIHHTIIDDYENNNKKFLKHKIRKSKIDSVLKEI